NLPAFILRPSGDGIKHHRDIYLTYQGNEPAPNYILHYADPASTVAAHKNCYAAAIFDCFNPEILYGEVLARPDWTQPTLSAEELRRNGGIPPPPQPIIPNEFVIQLYNPEQQVKVELRPGKWGSSDSYEFSLPQHTFREPSASNIDRGQHDPAMLATTPKLNFVWRKESVLSKDLTCFMTGKSTDTWDKRKARKDPDIAIALWRSMRELTLYEPNLQRLELEDPKGLEVVLLLGAIVIRDLFFTGREHVRELFNVGDAQSSRKLSAGGRTLSNEEPKHFQPGAPGPHAPPPMPLRPNDSKQQPERADEAERLRLLKIVEQEERDRQAAIERETERLRQEYGVPGEPEGRGSRKSPKAGSRVSFMQPSNNEHGSSSSNGAFMMSGANGNTGGLNVQKPAKKKSFFSLRSAS
ncbi:uncharacterized protein K489DRAFT_318303, partial [Dissoconium aciculare CBS 342.82]|uniref:Uncharacterized protein n=1 Tax=Dissoconium aciculare CBS 342.82 TaxID=1314786 RepID=A0A6J3M5Z2_9PEZI